MNSSPPSFPQCLALITRLSFTPGEVSEPPPPSVCYVRHGPPSAGGGLNNNGRPCISHPSSRGRSGVRGGLVSGWGLKTASPHSCRCQAEKCSWGRQCCAATSSANIDRHEPSSSNPSPHPLAETRMTSCCITNSPEPQHLLSSSHCERQSWEKKEKERKHKTKKDNDDRETQPLLKFPGCEFG